MNIIDVNYLLWLLTGAVIGYFLPSAISAFLALVTALATALATGWKVKYAIFYIWHGARSRHFRLSEKYESFPSAWLSVGTRVRALGSVYNEGAWGKTITTLKGDLGTVVKIDQNNEAWPIVKFDRTGNIVYVTPVEVEVI
jgi:hypothetical protein